MSTYAEEERLPELDRHALVMADLAYLETPGPAAGRVEAAIKAYLWAAEVGEANGWYPSLNEWRGLSGPSEESER